MSKMRVSTVRVATVMLFAIALAHTQTLTPLATFSGANGGNPELMSLAQGFDGNLYGTTFRGGASSDGVVFELKGTTIKVLHNFTGVSPDGSTPFAGLLLAPNG